MDIGKEIGRGRDRTEEEKRKNRREEMKRRV